MLAAVRVHVAESAAKIEHSLRRKMPGLEQHVIAEHVPPFCPAERFRHWSECSQPLGVASKNRLDFSVVHADAERLISVRTNSMRARSAESGDSLRRPRPSATPKMSRGSRMSSTITAPA